MRRKSIPQVLAALLAGLMLAVALGAAAEPLLLCARCGKRIQGRYIMLEGRPYCSQACLEQVLPKCELCGKPLAQFVAINGHRYCPEHASLPHCSECMLPFAKGYELPDGRHLCEGCDGERVRDLAEARALFLKAMRIHHELTGLEPPSRPDVQLVGLPRLAELSQHPELANILVMRGYYQRQETTFTSTSATGKVLDQRTEKAEVIYLLDNMRRDNFLATAVHELTHKMIADRFPELESAPLWVQEGICQYLAAVCCRRQDLPRPLAAIANSPDSVYGAGYRYFQRKLGDDDCPRLLRYLRSMKPRLMPAAAPVDDEAP